MALGGPLTVISVEYRLSPEYLFPIPINDGWDAFKHIVSHLPDLVPDASRPVNLVICGSSSGGQLAALVSQRAREWLVEPENATVSQKVNLVGVLLRAPVTVRGVAPESIPPRFQDAHSSWCAELETVRLDRAGMKEIHGMFPPHSVYSSFHVFRELIICLCLSIRHARGAGSSDKHGRSISALGNS